MSKIDKERKNGTADISDKDKHTKRTRAAHQFQAN